MNLKNLVSHREHREKTRACWIDGGYPLGVTEIAVTTILSVLSVA